MSGTWQPLANQPSFPASTMLLLTDGSVMCQASGGKDWWRLNPSSNGSYLNGTWTQLASMAHARLYYASAVMSDGRVFVAGGEYSDSGSDFNGVEVYDPYLDTWTTVAGPGWPRIGDAISCVLADGRVLLGSIFDRRTAIFDSQSETWISGGVKDDASDEETWTLLPDGSVLTVECSNVPNAERYLPSNNSWVSAGQTPVPIVETTLSEIGPALLLPDGRVFCVGGNGHTALYTAPGPSGGAGTWTLGPDFPQNPPGQLMKANDAPGCLLPNGLVLCTAGIADNTSFASPTSFFEFDPSNNSVLSAPAPPNAGGPVFTGRMLLLPTGQVMFAAGTPSVQVYTPNGGPQVSWKPVITGQLDKIQLGQTYTLFGKQLNGLSQAVSYGDDAQMATNYPVIRLRHHATGQVVYCPTFGHSTMAVATGASVQSTNFMVPWTATLGPCDLCVIANGIDSDCVVVRVAFERRFGYLEAWNRLIGNLADGPLWVLGPHGPRPVGPMYAQLAQRATQAYTKMRQGLAELELLAGEIGKLRAETTSERLPAKWSGGGDRSA